MPADYRYLHHTACTVGRGLCYVPLLEKSVTFSIKLKESYFDVLMILFRENERHLHGISHMYSWPRSVWCTLVRTLIEFTSMYCTKTTQLDLCAFASMRNAHNVISVFIYVALYAWNTSKTDSYGNVYEPVPTERVNTMHCGLKFGCFLPHAQHNCPQTYLRGYRPGKPLQIKMKRPHFLSIFLFLAVSTSDYMKVSSLRRS